MMTETVKKFDGVDHLAVANRNASYRTFFVSLFINKKESHKLIVCTLVELDDSGGQITTKFGMAAHFLINAITASTVVTLWSYGNLCTLCSEKNTHSHFLSYLHELLVDLNKNCSEYTQVSIDSEYF